jgi:hypothetical protein
MQEKTKTLQTAEAMTKDSGGSSRTFKNALIWCVADSANAIYDEARKVLAWEDIEDEKEELHLDEAQRQQLTANVGRAERDLKESVWRTYKNIVLLGKDNPLHIVDLGLVHSSAASAILGFILERLERDGEVDKSIGPNRLVRNWPPAFREWSTKAVRDAIFASPLFPRLLDPEAIKDTIARGVEGQVLAYVGKSSSGDYEPFRYEGSLNAQDVEISDDMYIVTHETAENYKKLKEKPPVLASLVISPNDVQIQPGKKQAFVVRGLDQYGQDIVAGGVEWKATGGTIDREGVFTAGQDEGNFAVTAAAGAVKSSMMLVVAKPGSLPPPTPRPPATPGALKWTGEIPPQKWMNFYTKVLSKFAGAQGLKLTLSIEVSPEGGISSQRIDETRMALQELGLNADVQTR